MSDLWSLLPLLAGLAGGLVLTGVFFALAFTVAASWVHENRERASRETAD